MIRVPVFPLLACAGLATILGVAARADDSETQALRKEVEELRQKVQKLEEQQATKPGLAEPASAAGPSSTPAATQRAPQVASPPARQDATPQASATDRVVALRESWHRVTKNMSQAEILDLLGQPSKETHIDSKLVWYYYYPGIGGASVFFKSNGHVSSYQAPNIGWW